MTRKELKILHFQNYGKVCWLCREKKDRRDLTLHHIEPIVFGGEDTEENTCIACTHCHFEVINKVKVRSKEYRQLMKQIEDFRNTCRRN